MIDEKYSLIEEGVPMSAITEFDEGIERAIDQVLDDLEYEPNDRDGLSDALRDECYKHIVEFAEME
jgi:hypothetical protein